jgi:acetyl esterase
MPLDPQIELMRTARMHADAPQLYTLSVADARAADLESIRAGGGEPERVHEVYEREIPGPETPLTVRLYRPEGYRPEGAGPMPVLLYFFGGGWTLGSIDTSDGVCRRLANAVPCTVVTVGYRLAPEWRFPAAVEDCFAATRWVAEHAGELGVDAGRMCVAGDSAGGNLAAAVTLLARDRGGVALAGQVLVYPNTDYASDTPSLRENTDPWLFNATSVGWYWSHYLGSEEDGAHPLASPLRAETHRGLPPALVITAEYDPLRDQAEQYAQRLAASGVPTRLRRYDGMVHGFFTMLGTVDAARLALAEAAAHLRGCFQPGGQGAA